MMMQRIGTRIVSGHAVFGGVSGLVLGYVLGLVLFKNPWADFRRPDILIHISAVFGALWGYLVGLLGGFSNTGAARPGRRGTAGGGAPEVNQGGKVLVVAASVAVVVLAILIAAVAFVVIVLREDLHRLFF
jgi:hypothetical protein